jgi:hypothetical protein
MEDFIVNMTPSIDKRLSSLETLIENLIKKQEETNKLLLEELKQIKENTSKVDESLSILQENRRLYLDALEKIQKMEKEELKPLLEHLNTNNDLLTNNLINPSLYPRMHNLFWRSNVKHLGPIGALMGNHIGMLGSPKP